MRRTILVLPLSILAMIAAARPVPAQTVTAKEFACMVQSTARAEAKFVTSKFKCISRCFYEFWHSGIMASDADCLPPYGGETAFCIDDALLGLKGAKNKFSAAIQKACVFTSGADCPECYSGGDCTATGEVESRVTEVSQQVDAFVPGIFCERVDAMPQEQWCQRGTAKVLAKYVAAQHKCYAKCFTYAQKGLIPADSCLPPGADPTLATCLATAAAKSTIGLDKICNDDAVPHSEPECGFPYPDGAAWTNLMGVLVSGNIPRRYCGD